MDLLSCKCDQCDSILGQFVNFWTRIGKSYLSPILEPDHADAHIVAKGATRLGENATLVAGCQLQDIACKECDATIGLKCVKTPVNHVFDDNQILLRGASVAFFTTDSENVQIPADPVIMRTLKLRDLTDASSNTPGANRGPSSTPSNTGAAWHANSPPHPTSHAADNLDITQLQASIEAQRQEISRIDSTGYHIVSSFDEAVDRIEREVQRLKDSMIDFRREIRGDRDDLASLKANQTSLRRASERYDADITRLDSAVQGLLESTIAQDTFDRVSASAQSASNAIADLRQLSLDRAAEANDLRRDLASTRAELQRIQSDFASLRQENTATLAAIKNSVAHDKKTAQAAQAASAKEHAREISSLRRDLAKLRNELEDDRAARRQAADAAAADAVERSSTPTLFSSKELDILTTNIAKIGSRASQIENLQMEFQLFKSRLRRLEETRAIAPAPSQQPHLQHPRLDDFSSSRHIAPAPPRRKRPSHPGSLVGEDRDDDISGDRDRDARAPDSTPNKRFALSSDFSGSGGFDMPPEWPPFTSPTEIEVVDLIPVDDNPAVPSSTVKSGGKANRARRPRGRPPRVNGSRLDMT